MALSLHEQRALNDSRQHQALTDELTGLGNRRYLLDELEQALTALPHDTAPGRGLALLLIDLDHFKEINDSFGHQTGDALLRQIGPRIRQVVRRNDLVARLGGDEFAVLLYGADAYKASAVAQRIATLLEQPIDLSTASLHVGASIGVALAPDHALTAADLIRCADIAMYRAKSERGSFDVYEAALDDEADRFALIEDLRAAMDQGSLALHYQPEIDLRTGEVVTVEALLRWPHPTLGLIPPEHLLALAEESGLIHSLASWVFEEAIADCARWWHEGHRAAVAVNLLATDLLDSSLPRRVGELLTQSGLPTHALVLEITEGMVVADLTRSKRVIQSLTDSGILVSIDDFGTGFSSLSHLDDLAVGELKLDRTFTSRLSSRGDGRPGRGHCPINHQPRPRSRTSRRCRGDRASRIRRGLGGARLRHRPGLCDSDPLSPGRDQFRRAATFERDGHDSVAGQRQGHLHPPSRRDRVEIGPAGLCDQITSLNTAVLLAVSWATGKLKPHLGQGSASTFCSAARS